MSLPAERDNKGRFTEGNSGKPRGAKHKLTARVKQTLEDVIAKEYTSEKIEEYLQELDNTDKLRFFVQLLPYVASKAPAPDPEPDPDETAPLDLSKFTDDELRYIAKLQEKARANNTPPIRWGDEEPMKITRIIVDPKRNE